MEVGYAGSAKSRPTLVASRGERVTIPIFISFTSLDPDLKSIDVLIDPSGEVGLQRWQSWNEYDSQGKKINGGTISINSLVSYDREGFVTIQAGGRVELNMFVDIPLDLPALSTGGILLAGVGIDKDDKERGIFFYNNLGGEITLDE